MKQLQFKTLLSEAAPRILQGIVLCMLLLFLVVSLIEWYPKVIYPVDLDYTERWHAYIAFQAFPGGDHVTSAYAMPHTALPYPPFSYLLNGWIGRLLGADLVGIRTIGRVTTLCSTLFSSALIVLISRTVGVRWLWSVMVGLLFLTAQRAHMFAVSLRPDEMACAIMLLGLYTVLRTKTYWLTGIIFTLALATKQSFFSVPLVLTVLLLLKRDFRSAAKLVASSCLTGLVIVALSTWMLGSYWWQGSLLQGLHGADFTQMAFFIREGFKQPVLVVGLAGLLLIDFNGPIAMVAAGFIVSLSFNSIALAKVGAASNYFLEPIALASILTAYIVEKTLGEQPITIKRAVWTLVWALVLALITPVTLSQSEVAMHLLNGKEQVTVWEPIDSSDLESITKWASQFSGSILTDRSEIYFNSGHKPFVCPPDLIRAAVEAGKIDGKPMQQFIEQRKFDAIVVRKLDWDTKRFFSRAWIAAIEANYQESEVIGGFKLMKPRGN